MGSTQEFSVPCDGNYRLEVWGAQGFHYTSKYYGGYGGYSIGIYSFNSLDKLYVIVGEKGKGGAVSTATSYASYPNGGIGYNSYTNTGIQIGSGGGSTHISKLNKLISQHTSSELSNLIIVAGGGGGYY